MNAAAAARGLGVGEAAASSNHTPAASGQHCPAITPAGLSSILRRPDENVPVNLRVSFEGAGEVGDENMQGNEGGNEGGVRNPYKKVQQPTDVVSMLRPVIDKIKQLLDGIFGQIFIKPRHAYKQQVLLIEQSLRILKAEKRLTMTDKADKVSVALQAEGTASARTIKLMIVDVVKDAKENEKKSKKSKKAHNKKGDKESKNSKGALGSGAHAKKATPKKNTKNS